MRDNRIKFRSIALIVAALPLTSCALADEDPAHDDAEYSEDMSELAVPGDWNPPPDVRQAGRNHFIAYEGPPPWNAGKNCGGRLLAGTKQLGDFLKAQFPGKVTSYGGYACRQNTANAAQTSVHGTGRALDIFIPRDGGQADNGKGDLVASWLIVNAASIGVQYIIWDRASWGGSRTGDKIARYTGPHPHHDHIHVELTHAGAMKQTPWFNGGGATPPPLAWQTENGPAFTSPNQQHVLATMADGTMRHLFWDSVANQVLRDTWATGVVGVPATFVAGAQQHSFVRTQAGDLGHWFWDGNAGQVLRDTWGNGIASDPAAALIGNQQHAWAVDGAGNLKHWFWDNGLGHDVWGSGVVGRPSVMVTGVQQHVFVRGVGGTLEHFFWDGNLNRIVHDTWGNGIAGPPVAALAGNQQHVWAIDGAGQLKHWFWDNGLGHDIWGGGVTGRPTAMIVGNQQHVWARGTGGTLEHFFWNGTRIVHDTWGGGAIVGDPVSRLIGNQWHVWAQAANGDLLHWFWDNGSVGHDNWGR